MCADIPDLTKLLKAASGVHSEPVVAAGLSKRES